MEDRIAALRHRIAVAEAQGDHAQLTAVRSEIATLARQAEQAEQEEAASNRVKTQKATKTSDTTNKEPA